MAEPTDRQLLELAGRRYRGAGSREQAMRDELDLGDVAFWRRVNAVLDDPAPDVALEFGPTINRLRRLRDSRQRHRTPRRAC